MKLSPRLVLTFLVIPVVGFAQVGEGEGVVWLLGVLDRIAGFFAGLLVVTSIIFIIIAAFNFLTSGGNEEKVRSAKSSLVYAAIAIIVAAMAFFVPDIILDILGIDIIERIPGPG